MNIKATAVTNAANLSLFMVNFSHALVTTLLTEQNPDFSVLDLKSYYRGYRYASETIKMLPQMPYGTCQFIGRYFSTNRPFGRDSHRFSAFRWSLAGDGIVYG
jgi:hypothetical protein